GTDGSQVSIAAIVPEFVVELYDAVRQGDLARAQSAHEHIYPIATAIYGTPPARHAHARIKRCLIKLGRLRNDLVRPPIGPVPDRDDLLLEEGLRKAGFDRAFAS